MNEQFKPQDKTAVTVTIDRMQRRDLNSSKVQATAVDSRRLELVTDFQRTMK